MVSSKVHSISPEQLSQNLSAAGQQSKIFLGGPSVGKSHHLKKIEDISIVSGLTDINDGIPSGPIVIDDFYLCFREYLNSSHEQRRKNFENIISRSEDVYLSTRPFDLEWLISQTPLNPDDIPAFQSEEIIFVRYTEEDLPSKCLSLDSDFNVSIVENEEIRKKIKYVYDFNELEIDVSYETYLPALLLHITEEDLTQAICWSSITTGVQDSIANSNISGFLHNMLDEIPTKVKSDIQKEMPEEATKVLSSFQ